MIGRLPFGVRRLILRGLSALSVKMTLFFGAVFALAAALSIYGTRQAIENYAERAINAEMTAGSAVFDSLAAMQADQLRQAGRVLSADFGFRAAAATGDAPTIASALESLQARLNLNRAFMVGTDGQIAGQGAPASDAERAMLIAALDAGDEQGIVRWDGGSTIVVAAPVKAPVLIGWVVFARDLSPAYLERLAKLSALDLHPVILPRSRLPRDVVAARAGSVPAVERRSGRERMLVQASPLDSFGTGEPSVLVLEYSLTRAMAAYRPILTALLVFGLIGVGVAIFGSFILARRLTRPISALDAAARKVGAGSHAQVAVETRDEIGRLARRFNRMVVDIEARERQIAHMAFHDALTGLANRTLLREHMAQMLGRARRDQPVLLFCLDLDNFKTINDTLGHPTGDALLCAVATRLQDACPDGFVARLGGDEFAIMAPGDERQASVIARAILQSLETPLSINGHRIVARTSIGITIAPQDGDDPVQLLRNADLALYRAKNEGKGDFRFFESAMDAEAQARREMEADLHDAMRNGELELHFQPLFGLSQNKVTAFEALMRWNHPTRGTVPPVSFIPLAEDTGLIVPMGEWALREACRIAATWPDNIRVAVNISPVQFRSGTLNRAVLHALAASGLPPERLELEITESLFIDNVETTLASLHTLRALGVRVALDDFGTGYSSLSYLRSFPFDKIKIDRSFIVDLLAGDGGNGSNGATAIIRSITTLAEALGMETTAEGVENSDQLDILRQQGCNQIQGYYFSRPIPAAGVAALIADLSGQDKQRAAA